MSNCKLKNVILYLCSVAEELGMGLVQMLKTILYADVVSLLDRSASISEAKYMKAPRGPVPDGWEDVLKELAAEGKITVKRQEVNYGTTEFHFHADPASIVLSDEEMAILKSMAKAICDKYSGSLISELTHNDVWRTTEMGEEIPIAAYFPQEKLTPPPELVERTINKLRGLGYVQ